jgi:dienelactone hydrolase
MGRTLRTGLTASTVCAAFLLLAPASPAAPSITSSFNDCPTYGDLRICSGEVPSFDGSKLDVDLTLPAAGTASPHPLIVLFHGFGNNKHEWESTRDEGDGGDKYHWNSHWFATHGYYVLTYTARGFRDEGPSRNDQPATPSGTSVDAPSGTIHLKSREFEIRDSQWLAALVAASYSDVDPAKLAVSGGSYGGGESWLLASQAEWTAPHAQDAALPVLRLQVAVPKYPWTDLAYSLAPNGHGGGASGSDLYESSQGKATSPSGQGNPFGVVKASWVTGFFEVGTQKGVFEEGSTTTPSQEGPINLASWLDRVMGQGEPYDQAGVEDPLMAQVRRGLTEFRGSYYQEDGWSAQSRGREVAIFSIQGWTDDLFEAIESFRQYKYLKRLDRNWPVALAVADVGHARAQNKPDTWHRLNNQAFQFLSANIGGSHRQTTTVASEPTVCGNDSTSGNNDGQAQSISASTPEGLSAGTLSVAYGRGDALTSTGRGNDPNGPATDPVFAGFLTGVMPVGRPCRDSPGPSPEYTATSTMLPDASTYVGLGYVRVPYELSGTTAQLDARVWDVAPNGNTLLMTRGTYRLDVPAYDAPAGVLRLPLFGDHWRLPKGHRVRLDLTQVDEPFLRRSNVASSIRFDPPTLVLPTRESGSRTLPGS